MRVLGIIIMVIGGLFSLLCLTGLSVAGAKSLLIIGLLITFLGYIIFVVGKDRKAKKQQRKTILEEKGIKVVATGEHMAGLPIGEGAVCEIYGKEDQLTFVKDGKEYNLDINKITDVTMKTDIEIQRSYVSSAGGAVGGAVLFGPLGAMIGGRSKKVSTSTTSIYLIFTYKKDSGIDYISFDVTGRDIRAKELANFTRARISTPDSVDL